MLYMLIERYTKGPKPIYERAAVQGRMLPEGLHYVDSWVVDDGDALTSGATSKAALNLSGWPS